MTDERMQRARAMAKDDAAQRILALEGENERYRRALECIGALDRLSYNPGEDPRGIAREALGGNDA